MKRPKKCIRLECDTCGRDDHDGITESQLENLRATWEDIREEQSWWESVTIWTEEQMRCNPDWSNLIWCTHRGTCPDCLREMEQADDVKTQTSLF